VKFVHPQSGIIQVELIDRKNSVQIKISDNGIGIPKNKLGFIFKRFTQIHESRDTKISGTGIGLAFSKQLADYIKAKLWAESEGEDKGATFFLELKKGREVFSQTDFYNGNISHIRSDDIQILMQTELKKRQETDGISVHFSELNQDNEFDYKKAKILIVEDDKTIRRIIMKYLDNYAFKNYIEAFDGTSALNAVYDYTPDLIICDYNMPNMRGDAFHDELLSNPQYANIPFIFLSAIADDELMTERRLKGACAYLKKPIDDRELFFIVEQQLKKYFEYLKTFQLATIDELTNLYNKRGIDKNLHHELSSRKCRHLSLIFFDIDHFKYINDNFGHPAGDKVLKGIGELLKKALRDYDITGRYGGEEFIIICLDTNLKQAVRVANIVKEKFRNNNFTYEKQIIKITASFGVASLIDNEKYICKALQVNSLKDIYDVKHPNSADWDKIAKYKHKISELLLKMADFALYNAKRTKCTTCGYSPQKPEAFENNTCPKCKGNSISPGRDKVVAFSNYD
jgi:diguanylate cyclase (GGDEF)-like protein